MHKLRLRFEKTGRAIYISHLDLMRTMQRAFKRAGVPIWYTQGFNPHAKVTFALPLSVGAQSECEFLDLRLARQMDCEEIRDRLNEQLTDEMAVLEVYEPELPFQQIAWATYRIDITCAGITPDLAEEVRRYLTTSPLMWEKKSKSGVKEVDITTMIRSLTASVSVDGSLRLDALLSVAGAEYLNPEYLVQALKVRFGLLGGDPMEEEYSILRTGVYLADGVTVFR